MVDILLKEHPTSTTFYIAKLRWYGSVLCVLIVAMRPFAGAIVLAPSRSTVSHGHTMTALRTVSCILIGLGMIRGWKVGQQIAAQTAEPVHVR